MKKIAFIGGTGAENSVLLKDVTEHIIETPYGEAKYEAGFFEGREIIHLSRHGASHDPPAQDQLPCQYVCSEDA